MKNIFFVILINTFYCLIIGFLTLDPRQNILSFIGALLFSILISYIISNKANNITPNQKILYFGSSLVIYLILAIINVDLMKLISNGFLISILSFLLILYFNNPKKIVIK